MRASPKVGTTGEQRFVVESKHAIDFANEGMPAVLSTPWLIWFLEHAAREAVVLSLEPGESTVGVQVEVRHLAPTPLGQTVTCLARVICAEGPLVTFQLEARDKHELIARGLHQLRVIKVERFARRVSRKEPGL
jgi:fluoroacetyl-CoA thioesterase